MDLLANPDLHDKQDIEKLNEKMKIVKTDKIWFWCGYNRAWSFDSIKEEVSKSHEIHLMQCGVHKFQIAVRETLQRNAIPRLLTKIRQGADVARTPSW